MPILGFRESESGHNYCQTREISNKNVGIYDLPNRPGSDFFSRVFENREMWKTTGIELKE